MVWWSGLPPQTVGQCRPCWAECCAVSSSYLLVLWDSSPLEHRTQLSSAARLRPSQHRQLQSGESVRSSYRGRSKYRRDHQWLLRPGNGHPEIRSSILAQSDESGFWVGLGPPVLFWVSTRNIFRVELEICACHDLKCVEIWRFTTRWDGNSESSK